jgi:hypothetical protein
MKLSSIGAKPGFLTDGLLLLEYLQHCKFGWNTLRVGSWLKAPEVNSAISSYGINPAILFSFLRTSEGFSEAFMKRPPAKLHDERMSDIKHL